MWNKLPENVVTAPSTNAFKNRLDKHWANRELVYDFRASIEDVYVLEGVPDIDQCEHSVED